MRKVFLHGELGNSLGKEWELEVDSVQEALWAIEANTNRLTQFLMKNNEKFTHYAFAIDGKDLEEHQLKSPIGDNNRAIHIMPQVAGGVEWLVYIVVMIVVSLVMQAIFKPPKPKDAIETNSYLFAGTQNVAGQGVPVPLGYGRLRVGSVVLSAAVRHVEYAPTAVEKKDVPVRLGTYDPENPSGGGQPGIFILHGAGPGGLGTLSENDIEYDENGKPFIPDWKLGSPWDDDDWEPWEEDGSWDDWCWVAREVYGANNPKWLLFRHWLLNYSPNWFCNWYKQNGKRAAKWLSKNSWLKPVIRRWMNGRIQSLQKNIK
tara:strand:+ start:3363 stop:4313 length:951 start_codon:yes stop_codon:yes gene_type:complete